MTAPTTPRLDTADLEARGRTMYEEVALAPEPEFHFETGRGLAEHLGYPAPDLDAIPAEAIDSCAGVGYVMGEGEEESWVDGTSVSPPSSWWGPTSSPSRASEQASRQARRGKS